MPWGNQMGVSGGPIKQSAEIEPPELIRLDQHYSPQFYAELWGVRCYVPRTWLSPVVNQVLERWDRLYLIHTYRPKEVCAPACRNAIGYDCQCSCMGENHGARNPGGRWYIVSDTFAVQWAERKLAVRLIVAGGVHGEKRGKE